MRFSTLFAIMATGASAAPFYEARASKVTKGAETVVFFEVGGVKDNECLTFRNNGTSSLPLHHEMCEYPASNLQAGDVVDAACVNTAADRQMTPSTLNGKDVLLVQRSFVASFRKDLVAPVQACLAVDGTAIRAKDCASDADFLSFVDGQLVSASGACHSGHDSTANLTVDKTGKKCAKLTTTAVTPTAP